MEISEQFALTSWFTYMLSIVNGNRINAFEMGLLASLLPNIEDNEIRSKALQFIGNPTQGNAKKIIEEFKQKFFEDSLRQISNSFCG